MGHQITCMGNEIRCLQRKQTAAGVFLATETLPALRAALQSRPTGQTKPMSNQTAVRGPLSPAGEKHWQLQQHLQALCHSARCSQHKRSRSQTSLLLIGYAQRSVTHALSAFRGHCMKHSSSDAQRLLSRQLDSCSDQCVQGSLHAEQQAQQGNCTLKACSEFVLLRSPACKAAR